MLAVAVAEHNAGSVAVLVAAGAVLPEPEAELLYLPFNYNDRQAVLGDLEQQAAAAGGGGPAIQYRAAADEVRAYCEKQGQEKINANAIEHGIILA